MKKKTMLYHSKHIVFYKRCTRMRFYCIYIHLKTQICKKSHKFDTFLCKTRYILQYFCIFAANLKNNESKNSKNYG